MDPRKPWVFLAIAIFLPASVLAENGAPPQAGNSVTLSLPMRQHSALVVPRRLDQLVHQASTIVRGRVVSVIVGPHPQLKNLTTVSVTLQVETNLKGQTGKQLTFRQFVWDIRDQRQALGFSRGQEVLLLLNPVSPYGLTSPAGLEQGRFMISRDIQGNLVATNGFGNAGLFADLPAQLKQRGMKLSARTTALVASHQQGPVPLDQLEEVIQQLTGASR